MNFPDVAAREAWERNFKAREHSAAEWQQHYHTFKQLYFTEDRSLPEARKIMAEVHNFFATEVQYKKRITKWKLEKSIKKNEMLIMLNKLEKRKAEEGKETEFSFKGRPVEEEKFERFQKRNRVIAPEPEGIGSPVATPSCIEYWTPRGSDPDTPMSFSSQREDSTPQPMDCSSPLASAGSPLGNVVNQATASTIRSPSPALGGASPASIFNSPKNYIPLDHHSPLYPWGRIDDYSGISANLQPQIPTTPSADNSSGQQHHVLLNSTRYQTSSPRGAISRGIVAQGTIESFDGPQLDDRNEDNEAVNCMEVLFGSLRQRVEDISETERRECQNLVRYLGYNKLAIKLAGAYIANSRISIGAYVAFYNESMRKILPLTHKEISTDDARITVAAFEVTFAMVEREYGGGADILLICAYLHHDNIADALFYRGLRLDLGDPTVKGSIDLLVSYSLIERIHPGDRFSINPLIHSWLRERQELPKMETMIRDAVLLIAYSIISVRDHHNIVDMNFERQLLPHLHSCWQYAKMYLQTGLVSENSLNLESLSCIATTMYHHGYYKEADELETLVLVMRKNVQGDDHPDTLSAMGNLAVTYRGQRRFKEAEVLEEQVLVMSKRVLGVSHPKTLTAMENLARTYRDQGRFREEEQLELGVLVVRKEVLGEICPDTLTTMGNLAAAYYSQGRFKEAELLEEQVLVMSKGVLGDDHPDTLSAMGNLAVTYRTQGRFKEAEVLEVQVLAMSKRVLGDDHPDTLSAMGNLAATYRTQGRSKEAEALEVQVLAMSKRVLGDDHPDTLSIMSNLAATYCDQGRLEEAERLQLCVLDMSKRILGNDHVETLTAMGSLAVTYYSQGRLMESQDLQAQVLATKRRVLGDDHPDTISAMSNSACTYYAQGRFKEAEELEVQVLEMSKRVLGDNHPDTLTAMGNLARTYRDQGQFSKVEELEVQVLAIKMRLDEDHPETLPFT